MANKVEGTKEIKHPRTPRKTKNIEDKPTVQVIKRESAQQQEENLGISKYAQEYLERKEIKRRKAKTFWIITGIVTFVFFAVPIVLHSALGPDAWILQFTIWNVFFPTETTYDVPTVVIILFRIFYTAFLFYLGIKAAYLVTKLASLKANNRGKTILSIVFSLTKYILIIVSFFTILSIAGVDVGVILAGAGVFGLILGFGMQSLVADMLAGLFIVAENSFEVGDIIFFRDLRGEVKHIGIRTTKILAIDGNIHVINNSELRVVTNMTQHRSVAICDITIGYEENLEKVEKIINDNLLSIAYKYDIITEGPDYLGVAEFNASGMVLRIKAKCYEANRMKLTRALNREMKLLLDKHKIKIGVPQVALRKETK